MLSNIRIHQSVRRQQLVEKENIQDHSGVQAGTTEAGVDASTSCLPYHQGSELISSH